MSVGTQSSISSVIRKPFSRMWQQYFSWMKLSWRMNRNWQKSKYKFLDWERNRWIENDRDDRNRIVAEKLTHWTHFMVNEFEESKRDNSWNAEKIKWNIIHNSYFIRPHVVERRGKTKWRKVTTTTCHKSLWISFIY